MAECEQLALHPHVPPSRGSPAPCALPGRRGRRRSLVVRSGGGRSIVGGRGGDASAGSCSGGPGDGDGQALDGAMQVRPGRPRPEHRVEGGDGVGTVIGRSAVGRPRTVGSCGLSTMPGGVPKASVAASVTSACSAPARSPRRTSGGAGQRPLAPVARPGRRGGEDRDRAQQLLARGLVRVARPIDERTRARHAAVHALLGQGVGLLECARRLGWALNTVKRYARAATAEHLAAATPLRPHSGRPLPRPPAAAVGHRTRRRRDPAAGRDPRAGLYRQREPADALPQPGPRRHRAGGPAPRRLVSWIMTRPADLPEPDRAHLDQRPRRPSYRQPKAGRHSRVLRGEQDARPPQKENDDDHSRPTCGIDHTTSWHACGGRQPTLGGRDGGSGGSVGGRRRTPTSTPGTWKIAHARQLAELIAARYPIAGWTWSGTRPTSGNAYAT